MIDLKTKNLPLIISIVSGKGGVGKSIITANLANTLANNEQKVLVWDGNYNFPNQHIMFGIEPPYRAKDTYMGRVNLNSVIYKINDHLYLLADYSVNEIELEIDIDTILNVFKQLITNYDFDFILIDTAAGLSELLLNFINISHLVCVVLDDNPSSLIDSYALIKIFLRFVNPEQIKLIINNIIDNEDFNEITTKINLVSKNFLRQSFETIGYLPYDREIHKSVIHQELFTNSGNEQLKKYGKFGTIFYRIL
ncbi:MAG TPA: AAA family ATPase [Candidatus Kapabacteria bacterium]|nr:AAA family ATPase [Candidatus Kapabacteria bacterium]